jgi:hypothetical protein
MLATAGGTLELEMDPMEPAAGGVGSRLGGPAAGLAERLRRVGLAEESVGALCTVLSVSDVKNYAQDREFWEEIRQTMIQNACGSELVPNDAEWKRFLAALPRIVEDRPGPYRPSGHSPTNSPSSAAASAALARPYFDAVAGTSDVASDAAWTASSSSSSSSLRTPEQTSPGGGGRSLGSSHGAPDTRVGGRVRTAARLVDGAQIISGSPRGAPLGSDSLSLGVTVGSWQGAALPPPPRLLWRAFAEGTSRPTVVLPIGQKGGSLRDTLTLRNNSSTQTLCWYVSCHSSVGSEQQRQLHGTLLRVSTAAAWGGSLSFGDDEQPQAYGELAAGASTAVPVTWTLPPQTTGAELASQAWWAGLQLPQPVW